MDYIFLPFVNSCEIELCNEYRAWLEDWLYELNENIEEECISSSECVQGLICERAIGKKEIDWLDVERTFLTDENNMPIAYSEKYGKRLYKFDRQWKQTPVYAIYNSYCITKHYGGNVSEYGEMIRRFIQPTGWIYNPALSETQIRTRMKSELMMSMAMGTAILKETQINESEKNLFEAALADTPLTGYVSAEYFRAAALENIGRTYQFPERIDRMLERCKVGEGYNDFSLKDKVDDYMGTKKRVAHDSAIHSPLISSMAYYLGKYNANAKADLDRSLSGYIETLQKNPMDIPAFRIRDIEYPFGTGVTPLEILAAASIVTNLKKREL